MYILLYNSFPSFTRIPKDFILSERFSFLYLASAFDAEDRSEWDSMYTIETGRLDLVYFAPFLVLLCSCKRRCTSVVIPT